MNSDVDVVWVWLTGVLRRTLVSTVPARSIYFIQGVVTYISHVEAFVTRIKNLDQWESSLIAWFTRVQRTRCSHASLVSEKMCWSVHKSRSEFIFIPWSTPKNLIAWFHLIPVTDSHRLILVRPFNSFTPGVQAWVTPPGWQVSVSESTTTDSHTPITSGWLFSRAVLWEMMALWVLSPHS